LSSKEKKKVTVSLEAIVAELAETRKYVEALQSNLSQLSAELNEIAASKSALELIKDKQEVELLTPTDTRGHVYLRTLINDPSKVVAHIGLNYYALLPPDKAIELLSKKEEDIRNAIEMVRSELSKVLQYYQNLQAVVNKLMQQAQAQQTTKG
jgi:prefoldin alpha subunit